VREAESRSVLLFSFLYRIGGPPFPCPGCLQQEERSIPPFFPLLPRMKDLSSFFFPPLARERCPLFFFQPSRLTPSPTLSATIGRGRFDPPFLLFPTFLRRLARPSSTRQVKWEEVVCFSPPFPFFPPCLLKNNLFSFPHGAMASDKKATRLVGLVSSSFPFSLVPVPAGRRVGPPPGSLLPTHVHR